MNLISRAEWGARAPRSVTSASFVGTAGHWNGPSVWGGTIGAHDRCYTIVQGIQRFHMDTRGWSDVAYGALACLHGYVFEGRGPGVRTAANGTNSANSRYSAVCYLGGEGDPLTPEGLQAMLDAWEWLSGGERVGHRDLFATACPGDEIYNAYLAGQVGPSPEPIPEPIPQPAPPVGGTNDVQTPTLRQGANGPQVTAMQGMLRYKGGNQDLAVDGDFGPTTDRWLRDFQAYYNVANSVRSDGTGDGVCGTASWQALVDV